jgi:inorganic phosphate transporter, PiT family
MIIVLIILAALYMGWSMGANDAANCVGADIGSGIMSVRTGIIITCLFSFLGAVFLGGNVIKTVGKGVVALNELTQSNANILALSALFSAALWITLASYKKFPVSTSHAIIGAVAGGGVALNTVVQWEKVGQIFICWVFTPVGSCIMAIFIYYTIHLFFKKLVRRWEKPLLKTLIYITSAYLAFTWGANDVANATGILFGTEKFTPHTAALIGSLAIIIGVVTWGYRVIETVGFRIIHITPLMTIAIEIATALNVHIYTHYGIPVSTSHSIIGAVWGVGIIQGVKTMNLKLAREIILTWALTPVVSGIITYIIISALTFISR